MNPDRCTNSPGYVLDKSTNALKPLECGKCAYCKRLKQWRLRKEIDYGVLGLYRLNGYMTFFTLTTSYDSDRSLMMSHYWPRYRAFLAYYGYKQEYAICPEYKNGLGHIHGIGDHFIPYQVMMGCWNLATWKTAWKTDVRALNMNKSASSYLVKYITKDTPIELPGKKRCISFSRGWPRRPKSTKGTGMYTFIRPGDAGIVRDYLAAGDPGE